MEVLRRQFYDTSLRDEFSRPKFRICVLFVDEAESVRRQLKRGQAARAHNEFVRVPLRLIHTNTHTHTDTDTNRHIHTLSLCVSISVLT
jgi:hypothetical protein